MKALRDLQEVHSNKHIQLTENPAGLVMSSTRCIRWLQFPGLTLSMRFLVKPIALWGLQPAQGRNPVESDVNCDVIPAVIRGL